MKKLLTLIVLCAGISFSGQAQDYDAAVGLRVGWELGLTGKMAIGDNMGEAIVNLQSNAINITGLYEIYNTLDEIEGVYWYYGGGAHVGFWNSGYIGGGGTWIGIDGILGAEYTLKDYPINFSVDFKPVINLVNNTGYGNGGAVSVRYTF